jgi:hypothetical protein
MFMPTFVQQRNGKIRRVSGRFGGSKAWKQSSDLPAMNAERRLQIEEVESALAGEQLLEALANEGPSGSLRRTDTNRRHNDRNRRRYCVDTLYVSPTHVVSMARLGCPSLHAVISSCGTIIAVPQSKKT